MVVTEPRYNEKGERVYLYADGEWYTEKQLRAKSNEDMYELLRVPTLSRPGTETRGRKCLPVDRSPRRENMDG